MTIIDGQHPSQKCFFEYVFLTNQSNLESHIHTSKLMITTGTLHGADRMTCDVAVSIRAWSLSLGRPAGFVASKHPQYRR